MPNCQTLRGYQTNQRVCEFAESSDQTKRSSRRLKSLFHLKIIAFSYKLTSSVQHLDKMPATIQQQQHQNILLTGGHKNNEFPLISWKQYLCSIADSDQIAETWRILTGMASTNSLQAMKHKLLMQSASSIDHVHLSRNHQQKHSFDESGEMKQLICSRLENVSWRVWFEKSRKNTNGKSVAGDAKENVANMISKSNVIIELPTSYREKESKISDWIDSYLVTAANSDSQDYSNSTVDDDTEDFEYLTDEDEFTDEEECEDDFEGQQDTLLRSPVEAIRKKSCLRSRESLLSAMIKSGCNTASSSFKQPSRCPIFTSIPNASSCSITAAVSKCQDLCHMARPTPSPCTLSINGEEVTCNSYFRNQTSSIKLEVGTVEKSVKSIINRSLRTNRSSSVVQPRPKSVGDVFAGQDKLADAEMTSKSHPNNPKGTKQFFEDDTTVIW